MPIAASVQGLGVHLRTAKATKSAALSQLADKETNTRTTKSRHENFVCSSWELEIIRFHSDFVSKMLSGVSEEIVGGNEELLLLFPIVCQLLRIRELRANCRALEVEVWLVQMMCGKWIGGMIFLLVGMFTNVLGLVYAFLEQLAQFYEIIVYSNYSYMHVDPVMPVMERLDTKHCVTYKLGKAATMYQIAEETYTTQTAALETAMSTPVFVQGSLNSVCNRYQLLIWAVVYTANEDLESITDTQTELQVMELDAHNFVKFKVQNSHYPNGPLQKESKFFF
ncbi:unnamed protein product [Malus baccata var. baccata]